MLQRTKGRLLLTLLVISGLAGTLKSTSISKKERKYGTTLMKDTKSDLLKSIKGLTEAELNFKAAPDKWSVKECTYHIAETENFLWSLLEETMKTPANPEKRTEIKLTDEQLVNMIEDRSKKGQAPEPLQPKNTGYKSIDEALDDFKKNRSEHIQYLKTTTEDLRNHVAKLSFGYIDCYQLCLFIAAHSNRHTQQLKEVMASASFPK